MARTRINKRMSNWYIINTLLLVRTGYLLMVYGGLRQPVKNTLLKSSSSPPSPQLCEFLHWLPVYYCIKFNLHVLTYRPFLIFLPGAFLPVSLCFIFCPNAPSHYFTLFLPRFPFFALGFGPGTLLPSVTWIVLIHRAHSLPLPHSLQIYFVIQPANQIR